MSDALIRLCNTHNAELRLIGPVYKCPYGRGPGDDPGHVCADGEWHLKRSGLPYSDPRVRVCPIHGKRLSGMGEVLRCDPYDHDVSTMPSDRPDEKPRVVVVPKPGDVAPLASVREEEPVQPPVKAAKEPKMPMPKKDHPCGTVGAYWSGCKCEKCKLAISDYNRAARVKRLAKEAAETSPRASKKGASPAPAKCARISKLPATTAGIFQKLTSAGVAAAARPAPAATVLGPAFGSIASAIERMHAAEDELAKVVGSVLVRYQVVPR